MKFIMCQPAIYRFEWELEVALTQLKSLGIEDIVLLFSKHNSNVPAYLQKKYDVEIHEYDDSRDDKSYIPSIKPYLWYRYLKENPSRQMGTYFYMDSDVLIREIPLVIPKSNLWYGSDCKSYLGVDYLDNHGTHILDTMCEIIGIDSEVIRRTQPTAGAQWIIKDPTIEYWQKVYNDCNNIYAYLSSLNNTKVQKWTAEMWAQLWNMYYFNIESATHKELDFCWATDPVDKFYKTKIYHNAGVIDASQGMFFKGQYVHKNPFKDNLNLFDPSKASIKYVDAIKAVVE